MDKPLEFFTKERGLTAFTLNDFHIAWTPESATFQYEGGIKQRFFTDDGRGFRIDKKKEHLGLFGLPTAKRSVYTIVCEGETDTMRLYQEFKAIHKKDYGVNVVTFGGVNNIYKNVGLNLGDKPLYFVLDNDKSEPAYGNVNKAWAKIKQMYPNAKRIYLPKDVKDVCEFFDNYTIETFQSLIKEAETHVEHYKSLDLTIPPAPYDWLVDEFVCSGDVAVMVGEPGVGKSWLGLALIVAIAEPNQTKYLGRKVLHTGRVLVVDEENPEDVVYHRLHQLGLTSDGIKNIKYVHRQGVRLDRFPDKILEDALEFKPTLIVLDSLSRLHTRAENDAGEISTLFNDGINPLSRQTGATVLLLHHVTKSDSTNSFIRQRGSGDISASADTAIDVRASSADGHIDVVLYKSRRRSNDTISVQIMDMPDGQVRINPAKVPF